MQKFVDGVALWLHWAGAALTVLVTLVIGYDVGGRLLFNQPFYGGPELAATGLVLIVFLQIPNAILQRKLLRVTFVYDLAGKLGRSALNTLAYAVGTAFFVALFATSWAPLLEGLKAGEFYGMDAFRIPAWPLRISTLILWLVAALVCLHLTIRSLRGHMTDAEDQIPE